MANVLITGGAGYVGGWLVDRAIEAGHDVRVYDLLLYEDRYLKDVPFISGRRPRPRPAAAGARMGRHRGLARGARRRPGVRAGPGADAQDQPRAPWTGWPGSSTVASSSRRPARSTARRTRSSTRTARRRRCRSTPRRSSRPSGCCSAHAPTASSCGSRRSPASATRYSRIRFDLVVNLLAARAKMIGQLQVFGGRQYRPLLHVRDVATGDPAAPRVRPRRRVQPRHREHDDPASSPSASSSASATPRSSWSRRPSRTRATTACRSPRRSTSSASRRSSRSTTRSTRSPR